MFDGMNATASALTSQRLRMDVVSSNMSNADSTRGRMVDGEWEPYRRKMTTLQPNSSDSSFSDHLNRASSGGATEGVKVGSIVEDQSPFRQEYNPEHPDADEDGYVELPNVDPLKEMIDLMSASRSYEANVTTFDAHKNMMMKALEIGRG
ncbi:flagellar basal body rod protein FlgC [Salisediminibacterium halotolerans]|nr:MULTISPECIES: flagellar basal body rod protein FlgC [Salisediminibacterium]